MIDEGVIKFKFKLKPAKPFSSADYMSIEKWRATFFEMKLIGEYPREKVGYGNMSERIEATEQFIITGTQTGKKESLNGSHYTKVTNCNLSKCYVEATGPIAPSSETLTHYAIYSTCSQVKAIFHVHDKVLWNYMISKEMESTSEKVSYGSEAMAQEASKCIGHKTNGAFVMKGHQDGVIIYGSSPQQAGKIVLEIFKESRN
jgi:hypothetical protein